MCLNFSSDERVQYCFLKNNSVSKRVSVINLQLWRNWYSYSAFLFYLIFITILYDIYSSIMSNIFIPVSKWQEKLPFRQINLLFIYLIWNLYFEKSFTTTSQIEDNKLIKILHLWSYPVFCIIYYFEKFSVLNRFCFCWLPFSNEFVGKMKKSVVI